MKSTSPYSRSFLVLAFLLLAARALRGGESTSGEQALARLAEGNERYVTNGAVHPRQTAERRAEVVKGQEPCAIVLTCADSRVCPEVVFDQGLGDLFVLRNAGNVLDDHTIGSIEYAVEHLHTPLIVVMGHEKCGAVSAAVAGGHAPGRIHSIVEAIEPAIEESRSQPGDRVDNAVRANARRMAAIIGRLQPILQGAIQSGKVKIVAARYDLGSGRVEILK
ncbi:MAG: carbonic anhydrase [Verrucomicrobiota bacterium]